MISSSTVIEVAPLGAPPWPTFDPFLFCVYHLDAYPEGNELLGPAASLDGRDIGQDFAGKDGWRMYHGDVIPGFPQHPHRGFETITVMREGLVDHSDSLGATARFGAGDVQWLTAGKGIVHSEMIPLVEQGKKNPVEFFQIWLNLPSASKMVDPYFSMIWREAKPTIRREDGSGRTTAIALVAGNLGGVKAPPPPPDSWASREHSGLAIWTITMQPGAEWTLPAGPAGVHRTLYVYRGKTVDIGGRSVARGSLARVRPDVEAKLVNGAETCELLMLQGRPIGEPVAQHGPFVMNTRAELDQAFQDYRLTRFGAWPFTSDGPVHAREETRFARYPDGRIERVDGVASPSSE